MPGVYKLPVTTKKRRSKFSHRLPPRCSVRLVGTAFATVGQSAATSVPHDGQNALAEAAGESSTADLLGILAASATFGSVFTASRLRASCSSVIFLFWDDHHMLERIINIHVT